MLNARDTVYINYLCRKILDIIVQRSVSINQHKNANPFLKLFPSLLFTVCHFIIYLNILRFRFGVLSIQFVIVCSL